jgi:tetratricopeptide (TPR) repeat protein
VLRLHAGRACSRLGRLGEAMRHLALAREQFERSRDVAGLVECLDEEATVLHLQEDPTALAVAQRVLRYCEALGDEVSSSVRCRILAHLGRICVSHHDWARGVRLLLAALDAQGVVHDVSQMAAIFNDLCVACLGLREIRRAVAYGRRSLSMCRMTEDPRATAQAQNNLGLALVRAGEHTEAATHLQDSLAVCDREGLVVGRSHVLLSLVELHLALHDPGPAERYASEAADLAERMGERMTQALALEWRGRVAEQAGLRSRANRDFEAAIDLLASLRSEWRLVESHATYGDVLERRGNPRRAMLHYRQAVLRSRLRRPG